MQTAEDNPPQNALQRHPSLWFQDGSIILQAKDTIFRVHRSVLEAHSKTFLDLFPLQDIPQIEGCAVITLQECPSDIANLLKVLYDSFWSVPCILSRCI
jgi:hypothetical protein